MENGRIYLFLKYENEFLQKIVSFRAAAENKFLRSILQKYALPEFPCIFNRSLKFKHKLVLHISYT